MNRGTGRGGLRGILLGWACVGFLGLGLAAADPYEEAQQLFAVGRPAEAAAVLGKALRTGSAGPDAWFNLGQAYSASGEPGKALWAWKQGVRVAPRDGGLRASVAQARQRTGGLGVHPLAQWAGWARVEEWAAGAMVGSATLAVWLATGWVRGGRRWPGFGWVIGTQFFLAAGWLASALGDRWSPDAVVVVREASVAVAPVPEAKAVRTLAEGVEVRVLRRHGDWVEVEVDGARMGWLRAVQIWDDRR